jgi:1-phosphatidylinositol phosphodiesterase
MNEFIPHASWMRDIPEDTPVTALSIPGTHNSASIGGPFGFAQTQNLDLATQLDRGIRFLDIRLAQCQSDLHIHHDMKCMGKDYTDILTVCRNFLDKHPSETILMSIKDESDVDSNSDKFAPSQVLRKWSGEDVVNRNNIFSFEDTLKAKTYEHANKAPLFYNFTPSPPRGDSVTGGHVFTSETTLGDARGKIVLLRRFEGSQDVGLDLTYWPENQTFRRASPPFYDVHDRYQGLEDAEKYELIVAHLEEAKHGDLKDLYITFSSAVDLTARGFAKTINPRLNDYLAQSPHGRAGIIAMDYFEEPPELVSNVIKFNQRIERPVVTASSQQRDDSRHE